MGLMSWRSALRIGIGGVVCALLVLAAGWVAQRAVLGVDDAGMRMRVETEVRSAFDRMSRRLREMALEVGDPATIRAGIEADTAAVRRLLSNAAAVVSREAPSDSAITIYGGDGEPVAWAGRPSDLPSDRLQGEEAWFAAPGASGLRLMYVRPVVENGTRVGTIAVERPVTLGVDAIGRRVGGLQGQDTDAFRFPTWIADVSMQLRYEGEPTADGATTFAIEDPSGNRLLTATVDSDDLAATRTRWQSATRSAALIVLAVTLLLCCGPLVDLRKSRSLDASLRHRIGVDVWRDRDRARHPACHIAGGLVGRACLLRRALHVHPARAVPHLAVRFPAYCRDRARTGHPAALRDRVASHTSAAASPRRIRRAPSVCHHAARGRTRCRSCFPRSPGAASRHDHRTPASTFSISHSIAGTRHDWSCRSGC